VYVGGSAHVIVRVRSAGAAQLGDHDDDPGGVPGRVDGHRPDQAALTAGLSRPLGCALSSVHGEETTVFERIVVGTDGSETATEAVRQAIELAKLTNAKLDLVAAFEPVPQSRLREEQQEVPGDIQYAVGPREDVNTILEGAAGMAKQEGVEAESYPREGDPADAILDVAEETGADLIVVGNKGMTGAKRFLLGSVPNKVSHHAPCGVYIVRTT
jgi:nucleotide-binding universal stress UspA family protein